MSVDYDHRANLHSVEGPESALRLLWDDFRPASVLDVGCGSGTWLKAALGCGAVDVYGVDGVAIPANSLLFPPSRFARRDLSAPLELGRRFDLVLCLEVAEHLEAAAGDVLVRSLCAHADTVLFSAACPGQPGQHHVNCQWPSYWQERFNHLGYACDDFPRWKIWHQPTIEPWYRQNLLVARKEPEHAGSEPRLCSVIHPEFLPDFCAAATSEQLRQLARGAMPAGWYAKAGMRAIVVGLKSALGRREPQERMTTRSAPGVAVARPVGENGLE